MTLTTSGSRSTAARPRTRPATTSRPARPGRTTRPLVGPRRESPRQGSRLEPGHQISGHPSAVLHLDALLVGPLADWVLSAPAAGALRPPRAGRRAPPPAGCPARTWQQGVHGREKVPQRLGLARRSGRSHIRCRPAETDSALSLAAIKVLDEHGLCLLGHRFAVSSLPHHQRRPAETYKSATTWICERSQAREAIALHQRLCAEQITAGYSRGDAVAEPALPSSARDSPAVSACLMVISPYDTGCPPSIT